MSDVSNPMADLFPPEMARHGLTFDFANAGESFKALVTKCWELDAQIKAASETKSDDNTAATHPYDVKASKDKVAAKTAADLLSAFVTACDNAIAKNRNVAWHLAQTDSQVTQYLTSEMQYYRLKEAPAKPATSGSKLETMREDRKVLTQTARKFLEAFPMLANSGVDMEDGKVKLPNLQGAGNRSADVPTGRYAKYRQTIWSVDGNIFPIGTDPRELVRAVWSGVERVGKKPTDIFEPIDSARKNHKGDGPVAVTINGHTVTYQEVEAQ